MFRNGMRLAGQARRADRDLFAGLGVRAGRGRQPGRAAAGSPARAFAGFGLRTDAGAKARTAAGSGARPDAGFTARTAAGSPARAAAGSPALRILIVAAGLLIVGMLAADVFSVGLSGVAGAQAAESPYAGRRPLTEEEGRRVAQAALAYAEVEYDVLGETHVGMPYLWGGRTTLAELRAAVAEINAAVAAVAAPAEDETAATQPDVAASGAAESDAAAEPGAAESSAAEFDAAEPGAAESDAAAEPGAVAGSDAVEAGAAAPGAVADDENAAGAAGEAAADAAADAAAALSGVGVDASGLAVNALRALGPGVRFAATAGHNPTWWDDATSAVLYNFNVVHLDPAELRAGDLVFFGGTVDGEVFVQGVGVVTGRSGTRVDFVVASAREGRVIHTFARTDGDYWRSNIIGAGRFLVRE